MAAPSPTPRRVRSPRWLDLRLVVGVALVAACVLIGSVVVSRADSTTRMWSAARDLASGTVLRAEDLRLVPVRLPQGASAYAPASQSLVGRSVQRPLNRGELIPQAALANTEAATRITISFGDSDAPALARGQRIEVWVSTKACLQVPLLADATVQDVTDSGNSAFSDGSGQTVVVRVSAVLAARVVTALALEGVVIRAGILEGPAVPGANDALPSLGGCSGG